jgi:hypothetical protein
MLTITIAGSQYPVHFGMRGLSAYAKKTGFSFGQLVTSEDAVNSIEGLVGIAVLGLNEGARKAGLKNAKTFTEDDLWDAIDEDPGILLQIADAFSISIKPLIDKLDRVVDPNS